MRVSEFQLDVNAKSELECLQGSDPFLSSIMRKIPSQWVSLRGVHMDCSFTETLLHSTGSSLPSSIHNDGGRFYGNRNIRLRGFHRLYVKISVSVQLVIEFISC